MAKIAFIILAHENATHVADLARLVTGWDDDAHAVIHYDLKSPPAEFEKLKEEFGTSTRVHLVKDRIRCGWGDFSLIDAVVRCLRLIRKAELGCERVMLMSGACMPIRPLREFSAFLDAHPKTEFIEAFDSDWIVGGLRKERYQYWHLFNHQTQHTLFNYHYKIQQKIWPKRSFPKGLEPRFGSQWWCLSWALCEKILDYIRAHPMIYMFFSTVWIPDEMFFQTMAFHFTPINDLGLRTLTFFHFNDWGKPLVFLDDNGHLLENLPYFFARKISNRAGKLRGKLRDVALAAPAAEPAPLDLPSRVVFPYKRLIAELPKADPISAPGLFQHNRNPGWGGILDQCHKSFGILYGPPQLTQRAAAALREVNELTVLGRLLHPEMVDFGPNRESFRGLNRNDNRIRDMDQPLYMGRILARCDMLPVFELCPGDDPTAEMALLQSENAIVLPIVPADDDEMIQQLYWILCSRAEEERLDDPSAIAVFRSMLRAVDRSTSRAFRDRTDTFLRNTRFTKTPTRERWRTALEFQHGKSVLPLVEAYDDVLTAVQSMKIGEIIRDMPPSWQMTLKTFADHEPSWEILRLTAPIVLPELWTTAMQMQALALSKEKDKRP